MNESDVKSKMVKLVKEDGGYARRIEDRYGVGILDCIFMPKGCPALFFAEVKIIRHTQTFGPTTRQMVEMIKVNNQKNPLVRAIVIGYREGVYYFDDTEKKYINIRDCFSVTSRDIPFPQQLTQFYYARIKK